MDVFVYGTLTDRDTAERVLSEFEYAGRATLSGLERADGRYPTLVPGDAVRGRLLRTGETEALDRYEGVDEGLYVRVSVPRQDGDPVETYVGRPDLLGVAAEWPGDGSFGRRVRTYIAEHGVSVTGD